MADTIRVRHVERDRFQLSIRHHTLVVDQPAYDGGDDLGPTPTELFVSGLASCVAFYAAQFLTRHHLSTEGLAVDAAYSFAVNPARVGQVTLHVHAPASLPEHYRERLMAVAKHCTVHNSFEHPPAVQIEFDHARSEAA